MPSTEFPFAVAARILSSLERERLQLADEIRHYPTPIAGCDQHFNWLLERQQAVRRKMQQADRLVQESDSVSDLAGRLLALDADTLPEEFYPHDTVHTHDAPHV